MMHGQKNIKPALRVLNSTISVTRLPFWQSGEANAHFTNSTFLLPRIVMDFFLNNQPDALIIQIYSVIKLA